jgi:hypothetical protein
MVMELAEELAVMGARKMILMTWGGTLQMDIQPGDIVVCNRAIRDEGASHHFLPPAKYVDANGTLVHELVDAIRKRGARCIVGTTWTTDAPYRETREEVLRYQAEGVKTVEMESAGLFTVGQVRALQTASVVIGMDSLAALRWQTPERLDGIMRSLEIVYAAATECWDRHETGSLHLPALPDQAGTDHSRSGHLSSGWAGVPERGWRLALPSARERSSLRPFHRGLRDCSPPRGARQPLCRLLPRPAFQGSERPPSG